MKIHKVIYAVAVAEGYLRSVEMIKNYLSFEMEMKKIIKKKIKRHSNKNSKQQ